MADRMLLRKSCFSFCSGLAVSRQDGVFYKIMFDGFGAVCRLGDVTGLASVYTKTYMARRKFRFFVLEWLGGKRISDHRACDASPLFRSTSKTGRQD